MANAAASIRLVDSEPLGPTDGTAADQTAFAASLGREALALGGVHDGRGNPATDRLRVYRNNVIVSLLEALRAAFPTTERLLGDTFFHNCAVAYAMAHKPSSPLMFEYGAKFPDFLASLPGVAPYPFVPEAARLERARIDATHAADATPLTADALAALAPESLDGLTFSAHPATRLVACPEGGVGAWAQNQDPPQSIAGVAALVTRPHDGVVVQGLSAPSHALANALLSGVPLGDAAGAADEDLDLPGTLALLLSAGAFADLTPGAPST